MTVLEAAQKHVVLPLILADRMNIGKEWINRLLQSMEYRPDTGCWIWQKANNKGYGVVRIRKLRTALFPVHRLCHQLAYGPIPDDLDVHHKTERGCIGRECGNPEHTQAVTRREHLVNLTPGSASYEFARRDRCSRGHIFTIETTRVGKEGRRCMTCEQIVAQQRRDVALEAEGREKFRWRDEHKKTHCKWGHALTPDNLYFQGKYGTCLKCRRMGYRHPRYQVQ